MPKISLRELRVFYIGSGQAKREEEKFVNEFSFQKILRTLSFYPVWFFLNIGMTANQVTLFAFLIGLLGCVAIAIGTYLLSVVGALLVVIAIFFDYVDGFVARYAKSVSKFGAIFDGVYVLLLQLMVMMAISVGLFLVPNVNFATLLNPLANLGSAFYLNIGLGVALVLALRWWLLFEFSPVVSVDSNITDTELSLTSREHINVFFRIHNLIMTPVYLWPYFLLLASILNLLYVFLLVHAVYHTLVLFAYAFYIFVNRDRGIKKIVPED